jgi:hypothetical protein
VGHANRLLTNFRKEIIVSAGNQPSLAQCNATAGGFATQLRSLFQGIQNFQAWLTTQTTAELEALGYSGPDAAVLVSTMGNLSSLAAIYSGGTPGAAFNYEANSNALWGGQ